MILVDTSVWVDHLRKGLFDLAHLLEEGRVLVHPLVIEELACGGNLSRREEFLSLLGALPQAPRADHGEVLEFVARHRLYGVGLSAVDIHLLASVRLARAELWSRDRRLRRAAQRLGVGMLE